MHHIVRYFGQEKSLRKPSTKEPNPPWVFQTVILHKNILEENIIPFQLRNAKTGDVPRGNFLNRFMIIIVFSTAFFEFNDSTDCV